MRLAAHRPNLTAAVSERGLAAWALLHARVITWSGSYQFIEPHLDHLGYATLDHLAHFVAGAPGALQEAHTGIPYIPVEVGEWF